MRCIHLLWHMQKQWHMSEFSRESTHAHMLVSVYFCCFIHSFRSKLIIKQQSKKNRCNSNTPSLSNNNNGINKLDESSAAYYWSGEYCDVKMQRTLDSDKIKMLIVICVLGKNYYYFYSKHFFINFLFFFILTKS